MNRKKKKKKKQTNHRYTHHINQYKLTSKYLYPSIQQSGIHNGSTWKHENEKS